MTLNFNRYMKLSGVMLAGAIIAVGCTKKEKTQEEPEVVVVEESAPIVNCDDPVALTQLSQSIKFSLKTQSQHLFDNYVTLAETNVDIDNSRVNRTVDSILVDIAKPVVLQSANDHGMVTCQASLSLTLPSNDIYRATQVYNELDGDSLQERLEAENILLNNNMLVANDFSYVVGMQGGQAASRVVGQPVILTAATDIVAKSQFNAALEVQREQQGGVVPKTRAVEPTSPAAPATPAQPASPRTPTVTEQRTVRPAPTKPARVEPAPSRTEPVRAEPAAPKAPVVKKPAETVKTPVETAKAPVGTAKPKVDDSLSVPTNETIEMVIIEENDTY